MAWREDSTKPVTPRAATNAKTLRKALTEPERRLWWHLRHRIPVDGSHFRRQVPIGAYVADFCCLSARLVVEVDGGQHGTDRSTAYDNQRDATLAAYGFQVLRFTNADVMREMDVVLDTIFAELSLRPRGEEPRVVQTAPRQPQLTPPANSSPQGGGESAER